MAKHLWSVLCRRAVVDQLTGAVSLFDLIEEINVYPEPQAPAAARIVLPFDFVVVSYWTRDNRAKSEHAGQRVSILSPTQEELGGAEGALDFAKFINLRNIAAIPGLPFAGFGTYTVRVLRQTPDGKGEAVAELPFELKLGPPLSNAAH